MLQLWYANTIDYCENILNNGNEDWKIEKSEHRVATRSGYISKLTQEMIY